MSAPASFGQQPTTQPETQPLPPFNWNHFVQMMSMQPQGQQAMSFSGGQMDSFSAASHPYAFLGGGAPQMHPMQQSLVPASTLPAGGPPANMNGIAPGPDPPGMPTDGQLRSPTPMTMPETYYETIIARVASIEAQLDTLPSNGSAAAQSPRAAPRRKNIQLIKKVHEIAHNLMGIAKERDAEGNLVLKLPEPLAVDQPPRIAKDGTALWNPQWEYDSTHGPNERFIGEIARLVVEHEKANPTLNPAPGDSEIKSAARQYYRTLRSTYQATMSERARERDDRRKKRTTRKARRRAKCAERRKQVDAFREAYGVEETKGLREILLTDYMSSEHSDCGNISPGEYADIRRQRGGGRTGHEIRRELWRSETVNRIYAKLTKLATDGRTATAASQLGQSRSRAGKARVVRYRGSKKNSNPRCPPKGIKAPFRAMISASWEARFGAGQEYDFCDDLPEYTILTLNVPNADLDQDDVAYLGDESESEDEDEEGAEAASGEE